MLVTTVRVEIRQYIGANKQYPYKLGMAYKQHSTSSFATQTIYIYIIHITQYTLIHTLLKHTILVISPVCGKLFIQIVYMHLTIIMAISMSISASNSMAKDININI